MNILYVEDSRDDRTFFKSELEKLGIKVDCAVNGKDAVSLFIDNEYNIIFMCVLLSDINGVKLTNIFEIINPQIPIIIISAIDIEDFNYCSNTDYIVKPYDIDSILEMIEKHSVNL